MNPAAARARRPPPSRTAGRWSPPRLGGRIVGPNGETVARIRPAPKRRLSLPDTTRSTILDGLRRAAWSQVAPPTRCSAASPSRSRGRPGRRSRARATPISPGTPRSPLMAIRESSSRRRSRGGRFGGGRVRRADRRPDPRALLRRGPTGDGVPPRPQLRGDRVMAAKPLTIAPRRPTVLGATSAPTHGLGPARGLGRAGRDDVFMLAVATRDEIAGEPGYFTTRQATPSWE